MNCEALVQYLSDYIDGDLDQELTQEAREHIATCRNCHVVLDSTQRTILLFRQQGRSIHIPAERQRVLYGRLADALAARRKNAHESGREKM